MITGKVIRVISDEEVLLSVGTEDGVRDEMVFLIYCEGDEIVDPETKEPLGKLEIVKGRVKVYHAQERFSVARTMTYTIPSPALLGVTRAFEGLSSEVRRMKLRVEESDLSPFDGYDSPVQVGDLVRQAQ